MNTLINLFVKIQNAQILGKTNIVFQNTKKVRPVLDILQKHSYIQKVQARDKSNILNIELKYLDSRKPAIKKIIPISKPGLKIYRSYLDFRQFITKKGILILSTSKGFMTNREAEDQKIGGEIICKVE